ncbi:MAG: acyl--CoA ligase, partial [Lachnospiraceae bacterium]|nr:acyl--CoA ligase [Lachnospiraceae bacterium]
MGKDEETVPAAIREKLESGALADQPCWSFIKELNSYNEERLESVAIRDSYRKYTYRQMFRQWERYAEAFSGLNITGANHSRAALVSTPLTESVFAFYGLNMTGASVSLIYHFDMYDEKQLYSMIEREKITDLVVSELFAFPLLMKRLLRDREMLGLRNIIVIASPMGGEYAVPGLEIIRIINKEQFRNLSGGYLMEELLEKYEGSPISYGEGISDIILHTTGTVSGIHKPVPMTDRAMNAFVVSALKAKDTFEDFKNAPKHMVTFLTLNMSWVYAMVDMLHTPLGFGMELVSLPVGATNPRYSEAIEHFGINILFTSKSILDSWLKTMPDMDLSRLKLVFMGGTYVSPEFKQKFNGYLRSCGSSARIINGYGLSELGGACTLASSARKDDAIGYLLPGFKAKIFVEEEKRYYDISEGPRTGLLLLNSPTMSSGKLGDTVFFELERVGDEDYFNSNDLVRVNEDGSLTCIGRSNQFFVNNAGVRFDAGLIENSITSQPGIAACGLAAEFHKTLHDNIPVLYVEMSDQGKNELSELRKTLIHVFIEDGMLADTNLPSQCVITKRIPLNSGGKVDGKKLASGTVTGSRYSVKPVKVDGKVVDILMVPAAEGENATMGAGVPEELENDPYTILSEVFALIPDLNKGRFSKLFKIPGLRELILKLTDFDIHDIPTSVWNMAPMIFNMGYQKYIIPFMKGAAAMSKNGNFGNMMMGFVPFTRGATPMMPMMPVMPVMPNNWGWNASKKGKGGWKVWKDDFRSNVKTFGKQAIDMQESSGKKAKKQWKRAFKHMMDMEKAFAGSMPDAAAFMPGLEWFAMSPKEFMKWVKGFQKMSNKHFVELADSLVDYDIEAKEQLCDLVDAALKEADKKKKKK